MGWKTRKEHPQNDVGIMPKAFSYVENKCNIGQGDQTQKIVTGLENEVGTTPSIA